MTFEFIITHQPQEDDPVHEILRQRLREALETNLNDVEDDALAQMVRTSFERPLPDTEDGTRRALLGFTLELSDETASVHDVVDDFADALVDAPITHAVKCEDPLLRQELAARAEELFLLEMKLRRVLSIIYLHAYPDSDPYNLLAEESVQPIASAKPQPDQMKAAAENQFFHLTFGQYVGLNQRPPFKDKDLISLIRNRATYDSLHEELSRQPVEHEDDAIFLASLKERMDSIEKLRNCVAHNRRPPKKTTNDYLNALRLVNDALDNFLARLAPFDWREAERRAAVANEPAEDYRAKLAVRKALENAVWDETAHTITLRLDDHRTVEVDSREALETKLRDLCSEEWHNHAMKIDGEFVGTCEDDAWVHEALDDYDERLRAFFPMRISQKTSCLDS